MSRFCRSADSTCSSKSNRCRIVHIQGSYQKAIGGSCRIESQNRFTLLSGTAGNLMADNDGSCTSGLHPAFHNNNHQGRVSDRVCLRRDQSHPRSSQSTHSNGSRRRASGRSVTKSKMKFAWTSFSCEKFNNEHSGLDLLSSLQLRSNDTEPPLQSHSPVRNCVFEES